MSKAKERRQYAEPATFVYRTETEAIEQARRDPAAREAQQDLGRIGIAIVGDQPGQHYVAYADDAPILVQALPRMRTCGIANSTQELLQVLLQVPGARRSETLIEFPRHGARRAILVPLGCALPWVDQATFPAPARGPGDRA
jgi:hypothetical protein